MYLENECALAPRSSLTDSAHKTEWATSNQGYILSLITWFAMSKKLSGSMISVLFIQSITQRDASNNQLRFKEERVAEELKIELLLKNYSRVYAAW